MENDAKTGPVFGARDQWNGLGVFFDSFDNDGQVGQGKATTNVVVTVIIKGTKSFAISFTDFESCY